MLATKYASFFKRFIAFVVDVIIAQTVVALMAVPTFFFLALSGNKLLPELFRNRDWCDDPNYFFDWFFFDFLDSDFTWIIFFILGCVALYWLYFALFESSSRQATPGKMIMGLFVTDLDGRRISFFRALARIPGKILSAFICYMGHILALFTARNQALHDLIAGTLVLEPQYSLPPPMVERLPKGSDGPKRAEQGTGHDDIKLEIDK